MLLTKPAERQTARATFGFAARGYQGHNFMTLRVARTDHDLARTDSSERENAQSGVKVLPSLEGATCLALHIGIPRCPTHVTLASHTGRDLASHSSRAPALNVDMDHLTPCMALTASCGSQTPVLPDQPLAITACPESPLAQGFPGPFLGPGHCRIRVHSESAPPKTWHRLGAVWEPTTSSELLVQEVPSTHFTTLARWLACLAPPCRGQTESGCAKHSAITNAGM